ncbi:MAG: transcriptional regulator [Mediterranea sp.]|jgi:DNA-binding CsgD family transcriptional regulator|nr:transcriptional regulator [Mediterranea sp.]
MNGKREHISRYVIPILVGLASLVGHTATGRNAFVLNFSKFQTARSGAQNWQIAAYDDRWVYFANQNGILQYNGNAWNLLPLHNGQATRSVTPSRRTGRIYVGGISEFGYYTVAPNGSLGYTCMSDSVSREMRFIGNVWNIHEMGDALYVQGDNRFLRYEDGAYTAIDVGCKVDCSALLGGILYAGTERGVKILVGGKFIPLNGAGFLDDKRIRGFVATPRGTVVVTASHGLYLCDGVSCVPYVTGVESFLVQGEVFCAATAGGKMALGTIQRGVVVVDMATGEAEYYNENNGLQNNTVLSLAFDSVGNLWTGTDNGIDYIFLSSPLSTLYPLHDSYGTGYAALSDERGIYLGTSRGLYLLPASAGQVDEAADPRLVRGSGGQVWSLRRIGSRVFCFHDRGVFLVEPDGLRRVGDVNGAWTGQMAGDDPETMFVGGYDGLYVLRHAAGRWTSWRVLGMSDSFRFFEQESRRVLWMSDPTHCFRVELDSTMTRFVAQTQFDAPGDLPGRQIRVHRVDGQVCFSTTSGFYRFDYPSQRMVPARKLNDRLGGATFYYYLVQRGDKLFGLKRDAVSVADGMRDSVRNISFGIPQIELVPEGERLAVLSDSSVVVPFYRGFLVASYSDRVPSITHRVNIFSVYTTQPSDSLLYTANFLGRTGRPTIDYRHRFVRVEFGLSSFPDNEEALYQYRLDDNEWSAPGTATTKEYTLEEGDYRFEVRASFSDGTVSADSFSFRVLPPWYRTNLAFTIYLVLLALLLAGLYKWDDTRVRRKNDLIAREKDKEIRKVEHESLLKEERITRLEKEKLERDLQYKSQEMANLMINFTQKNEMLSEIKSELHKVMSVVRADNEKEIRQRLLVVGNKIDLSTNSTEVLRRIEKEFDLVHDNFMTRLQERHPQLSFNERMMCAYLKMNLTSKEIAPLFNFSVRGVETMRYRLRKKLGLEREANLLDYLNGI